ncbi:uncharacterized protein [Narcine bancroftii]|uniref:uncharacterized protein n=1 Tax=Narcine bancroftii TaxID=1343680 RepID=UPI003831FD87
MSLPTHSGDRIGTSPDDGTIEATSTASWEDQSIAAFDLAPSSPRPGLQGDLSSSLRWRITQEHQSLREKAPGLPGGSAEAGSACAEAAGQGCSVQDAMWKSRETAFGQRGGLSTFGDWRAMRRVASRAGQPPPDWERPSAVVPGEGTQDGGRREGGFGRPMCLPHSCLPLLDPPIPKSTFSPHHSHALRQISQTMKFRHSEGDPAQRGRPGRTAGERIDPPGRGAEKVRTSRHPPTGPVCTHPLTQNRPRIC